MNLKAMRNEELITQTKNLCQEERRLAAEILKHLQEIESRRLYAESGFSSLHEFCVKELKYSEGAAYRRISAMRLLREIPEAEAKIQEGKLTLTTLSLAHQFFQAEEKKNQEAQLSNSSIKPYSKYSKTDKTAFLAKIENKSKRECEQLIAQLAPEAPKPESIRIISPTHIEVKITLTQELQTKLEQIKNLVSHTHSDPTYAVLIEILADLALKKLDPIRSKETNKKLTSPEMRQSVTPISRYIPASLKRQIWLRDQSMCQYKDPVTKRQCESRRFLEIDPRLSGSEPSVRIGKA